MADITPEDLRPYPSNYQTSRAVDDVLIGPDIGLPLIEASTTGDITGLRSLLEQTPDIALVTPHRIYGEDRPAKDKCDIRRVRAMERSNISQAVTKAAGNGHALAVSILLDFAVQNGVEPSSVIDREAIKQSIANGYAAVFEELAKAEPTVATFDIIQGQRPLDRAISLGKIEVARVVLQYGGGRQFARAGRTSSYRGSRLCQASRFRTKDMTELLLQNGYVAKGSGALQMAAARGAIETVRLLVEEYGVDVDEKLPAETLPVVDNALYASWSPMHFAASGGSVEAIKLLESYGANADVLDVNGRTPAQVLEERNEARRKRESPST